MQWGRGCIFPCSRAHVSLLNLVSFICLLATLARKEKQVHMLLTTLVFSNSIGFSILVCGTGFEHNDNRKQVKALVASFGFQF